MSNTLSEMVASTTIKPAMKKSVLREIADTVREKDLEPRFWRSQGNTALRIGTSASVVAANLQKLEADGLIFRDGEHPTPFGSTIRYGVCLEALLALPCIEDDDKRKELAVKLPCWSPRETVVTPLWRST